MKFSCIIQIHAQRSQGGWWSFSELQPHMSANPMSHKAKAKP